MKQMLLWTLGAVLLSPALQAQPLSPPLESPPAAPLGSGPGFHSPQSPIAPLKERDDLVSWKLLASVKTKTERNRVKPLFPDGVRALNQRTVKIQGFMMPLEPGDKQKHFLLSAVPTSCAFCVPAGPEGLVEVKTRTPVRYSIDPVVVEGQLAVLDNDPYGVFYRIVDAVPSK
jgi:hypothetical protein